MAIAVAMQRCERFNTVGNATREKEVASIARILAIRGRLLMGKHFSPCVFSDRHFRGSFPSKFLVLAPLFMAASLSVADEDRCLSELRDSTNTVFGEGRYEAAYTFHYSPSAHEPGSSSSPFVQRSPQDVLERPEAEARRLLSEIRDLSCSEVPEASELSCSGSEHPGVDPDAPRLHVHCTQAVNGFRAKDSQISFALDSRGTVTAAYVSLLYGKALHLPIEDWPSDELAMDLADAAYLNAGGRSESRRREVFAIERYYDPTGPIVALSHRECGLTTLNARTLEVSYECKNPPSETPWKPKGDAERLLRASPLAWFFQPSGAEEIASDRYLLWGRTHYEYLTLQDTDRRDDSQGSVIYTINGRGDILWERRFPFAAALWVRRNENVIRVASADRTSAHQQRITVAWLDPDSGAERMKPVQWSIPAGAQLKAQSDGSGFVYYWHAFDRSMVRAVDVSGAEQWTHAGAPGIAVDDMAVDDTDDVFLLQRLGPRHSNPDYALERLSPDGGSFKTVPMGVDMRGTPSLVGALDGRAFVQSGYWRADRSSASRRRHLMRGTFIREWDLASGRVVSELQVGQANKISISRNGSVLIAETVEGSEFVGEINMNGLPRWRELVQVNADGWIRSSAPAELSNDRFLVFNSAGGQDNATRQTSLALLVIDGQSAAARTSACAPFEREIVDRVRPEQMENVVLRRSPTLSMMSPECPADAERAFHHGVGVILAALKSAETLPAGQQVIDVLIKEGPETIESQRSQRRSRRLNVPPRHDAGALRFRIHPSKAEAMSSVLQASVLPHMQRMEAMRERIYAQTGVTVMVQYGLLPLAESLEEAEARMLSIASLVAPEEDARQSPPVTGFAWDERLSRGPTVVLMDRKIFGYRPMEMSKHIQPISVSGLTRNAFIRFAEALLAAPDPE